tara:strand:- start:224 stop:730 length:507 start_codon:yes stop_codon:yes gene_type:complete
MNKNIDENTLRYDRMVEKALRGVAKQAIEEVMETGLPGDHHFYITFLTDYEGVQIPDYLRERYPGEMTIVLQYQFYDLSVDDKLLKVTLSFNNIPEKLVVPLAAITIFADPSVNFALQFQPLDGEGGYDDDPDGIAEAIAELAEENEKSSKPKEKGEVVSLDQFRKKD